MSFGHLLYAAVQTLRISLPTIYDAALGRLTPEICDERLERWSARLLKHAEIELDVTGLEHAPPGEAFVVMSNHQSLFDIPVLYQSLGRRLRMVAKSELFRIPVWAQAMRRAGFVELDRSNRERAIQSLDRARAALSSGTSIWIAPEGTRSPTGALGRFKSGGFYLALAAGARILPVSIDGTRYTLPARGHHVKNGAHVRVVVHPPVTLPPDAEVSEALIETVRGPICAGLGTASAAFPQL